MMKFSLAAVVLRRILNPGSYFKYLMAAAHHYLNSGSRHKIYLFIYLCKSADFEAAYQLFAVTKFFCGQVHRYAFDKSELQLAVLLLIVFNTDDKRKEVMVGRGG